MTKLSIKGGEGGNNATTFVRFYNDISPFHASKIALFRNLILMRPNKAKLSRIESRFDSILIMIW